MQTFVPIASFDMITSKLDYRRLGKQRVECLQMLRALRGKTQGWKNHAATKMWIGHEDALVGYGVAVCVEWRRRGYKDTCLAKILRLRSKNKTALLPEWWGGKIHSRHRAVLLRKSPKWYSQFGWKEKPATENYWPTQFTKRLLTVRSKNWNAVNGKYLELHALKDIAACARKR